MKAPGPNHKLDCLDGLERHCRAVETLAGLLMLAGRNPELEKELVADAAGLILDEAGRIRRWAHRLAKEVAR